MNLQSTRIEFDKITSVVPLVNTLTNGVNLIQKLFVLPNMSIEDLEQNNYYSYLKNKATIEISLEMIPIIGNIYALYQRILWNNPKFVLQQIQKDSSALLKSSAYLQNNPEFLIKAFDQNKTILPLVPKEIKEQNKEFCLGMISVSTRKREELLKRLDQFLIKNEIHHDCKDTIMEEDSIEKDLVRKKKKQIFSLELFYAHIMKPDFNPTLNLLEDTFEKNTQTQKELLEQTNRLKTHNVKVKGIEDNFSNSNKIYKKIENDNYWFKIPGKALKVADNLINQGNKGLRFLLAKAY